MQKALIAALIALTLLCSTMWWRNSRSQREAWARVAALEIERAKQGASERQASDSSVKENETDEAVGGSRRPQVIRVPATVDAGGYLKTIDELRAQIAQMSRDLSTARDEAARFGSQMEQLRGEEATLRTTAASLTDDLQAARRATDALEAEAKLRSERLIRSETAEKTMRERLTRAEAAAGQVAQNVKEIEELNRRRDTYLTNLMRRFREVNDLYRNYVLNAQTRDNSNTGLNAGDLSRINATIQSAEDDLRQLQSLNARVAQLARIK